MSQGCPHLEKALGVQPGNFLGHVAPGISPEPETNTGECLEDRAVVQFSTSGPAMHTTKQMIISFIYA